MQLIEQWWVVVDDDEIFEFERCEMNQEDALMILSNLQS